MSHKGGGQTDKAALKKWATSKKPANVTKPGPKIKLRYEVLMGDNRCGECHRKQIPECEVFEGTPECVRHRLMEVVDGKTEHFEWQVN
jgi:hypothetical protein